MGYCRDCRKGYAGDTHICQKQRFIIPPNTQVDGAPPPGPSSAPTIGRMNNNSYLSNFPQLTLAYYQHSVFAPYRSKSMLDFVKKFDAVRQYWASKQPTSGDTGAYMIRIQNTTVAEIAAMTDVQKIEVIERFWEAMLLTADCTTPISQMTDCAPNAFGWKCGLTNAWTGSGYGFRCDTRDLATIKAHKGFRRWWTIEMPAWLDGTKYANYIRGIGGNPQVFMWSRNRDAVNENNICVSRTLKGSLKFPYPEYVGDVYVYALKIPTDKRGFDTEQWQSNLGGSALWRPGEKAFLDVDVSCIAGYLRAEKMSKTGNEFFRFKIHSQNWVWETATPSHKDLLTRELAALRMEADAGGEFVVMEGDDFYRG